VSRRVLIMGLPGSGKTTIATSIVKRLLMKGTVDWYNADVVREKYNDWDFSTEGRLRQAVRMRTLANDSNSDYVICDFVCPTAEMRYIFQPDWIVWMDTITEGRYDDTNKLFEVPVNYDFRITELDSEKWAEFIVNHITNDIRRPVFDWRKETVQMLGRWQPWHSGHRALFERSISKTGQVCIMIRDCQGWQDSNPFEINKVIQIIKRDLDPIYQGRYEIIVVPNIVNITYGRDVGYKIEQETFDSQIESISATNIRQQMFGVE